MDTLSIRAQGMNKNVTQILKKFLLVQKNPYDEESNPNGICNCGVAENYLCENELISKLQSIQVWQKSHMYYPCSQGLLSLRKALCDFFQKIFELNHQLDPDRMMISSGLSGIISLLSYVIGDRDDVFLISSPYYTAFDHDISAFSNCATYRCPLLEQDTGKFIFSVEIFKRGYDDAVAKGLRPRGIIIINPNNPIGDIYDEQTIQPVLDFAAEKNLHVIIDEIYALSLFEDQKPFQSMLNYSSIVDPKRTHFVWSFSKDFALSGVRLGVAYAGSSELCSSANAINFIQIPSNIVQEIATTLISDCQWIDSYTKLNRSRLTQQYKKFQKAIENIDNRIYIRPAKAGFFIWADLRLLLHDITFEEEIRLFQSIFEHGLYLVTGSFLGCAQPGWFRIIFSIRETWIDEAIKRFKLGLDAYQHSIVLSNA
ncbi:unnamed protein product [Rotaria socialis]|uniref:Aminotransferase class I/classII large domain-containing protein n=1 Tax=Rotaria socialis TaxID=392032 RepID=A0A821EXS7_9BILA|nr:unnamed protein product [Rotaria socialis]CAF3402536.1 unnamed protein product [Rotaria socialis]CAF3453313.1 unnamed protein product [Rotaria socialis]CAF3473621.1 unnamed protein product [Rotaria socialis]CAF3522124.1 unnamed protein product [Rotaria socialis]